VVQEPDVHMLVRLSIRFTLSMALLIFVLGALWLLAVPDTLGRSTYMSIATLLIALAAITLKTYTGGQSEGSLATLLHETDIAPRHVPRAGTRLHSAGIER
jgi:prepilin signal peptidase PulO-like enzyme (type II secretory pathway)